MRNSLLAKEFCAEDSTGLKFSTENEKSFMPHCARQELRVKRKTKSEKQQRKIQNKFLIYYFKFLVVILHFAFYILRLSEWRA